MEHKIIYNACACTEQYLGIIVIIYNLVFSQYNPMCLKHNFIQMKLILTNYEMNGNIVIFHK